MGSEIINNGKTLRVTKDTDKVDLETAKTKIEVEIAEKTNQLNKARDQELQHLNDLLGEVNGKLDQF